MNRTQTSYPQRKAVPKPEPVGVDVAGAAESYIRSCKARGLSPETIAIYRAELARLDTFLHEQGMPRDVGLVRREHIETWLADLATRFKPASVSMSFRSARTFFRWLTEDAEELLVSPMARMRAPLVPMDPPAVITQKQMLAMLDTCKGRSFDDRRDKALLHVLGDTGMRRGELVGINLVDVDLTLQTIIVRGESSKGKVDRPIGIGAATVAAIDSYLRARRSHPHVKSPALFIGRFGRLGPSGVLTLVKRRGKLVGIPALHPHIFRHTWAHMKLSSGATEGDVAALGGWRDRSMLDRYGAIARQERAIESNRRDSPMDRLVLR